ncbi:ABC transporter permease [Staphylococcus arlettae]|uniref:ABC transporter permease n=2 Tax=Staphylococcus arlettae TaxID=29378 RepID=UPI0003074167
MMNALHIAKRIVKQTLRDKRTLALLIIAPLLILSLLYYIFSVSDNSNGVKLGVAEAPKTFINAVEKEGIDIRYYDNNKDIANKIKSGDLTGFATVEDNQLHVTYANDNPTQSGVLASLNQKWLINQNMTQMKNNAKELQDALANVQQQAGATDASQSSQNNVQPYEMKTDYLYGSASSTYFDMINPILIAFFVFFFTFLISGIGLLKERTSGTLERLLASPIKRSQIIFGYIIGYGIFSIIQTVIVVLFAVYVLNIIVEGSILVVLLTTILTALVALTFGILLSTFAASEFQMIQFIPLVIVPQVLFAGLIPIESMSKILGYIAHIMPLYYAGQTMQDVMIKGFVLEDVYLNLLVLLALFLVLLVLNIIGMKRYRKV